MSLSAEDKKTLKRFLTSSVMQNNVSTSLGFKNFMLTQQQADAIVVNVESKAALSALMLQIQALNKNKLPEDRIIVRAAAGGRKDAEYSASYSATHCASADIVVRLTGDAFTHLSRLPNSNVVRVGASLQIGELDQSLYEKHALVLPTSSLIPYVTVAGLAAAGGHGTGKDQPSFAGLVCGATLCLENGEEVYINREHEDFATIMGANNGMFGVIISMDIECIAAKKMQCVMEKRSAIEFMEEVENGLFEHDPYVSAMYMPTYLPDEMSNRLVNNVIIYRWRPVPLDTKNTNHTPLLSDLAQDTQTALGSAVNIPEVLRRYPSLIPFYMRHITAPLAIGDTDELSVGPWHEMMHYRTSFPNDLTEICGIFPVKDQPPRTAHGQEIVKALKHAITLLDEHAKRGEYPITYGLYFRYLQGTNGGLSFTAHPKDHHVCAMDLTTNERVPGYATFEKSMQEFFMNEMNAKFHWGKNAPLNLDYQKMYGEDWQATKEAVEKWNRAHHLSTPKSALLNPLFSSVLKYPPPSLVDTDLPVHELTVRKQHLTAINARKLISIVGDKSPECEKVKAEINADINKIALNSQSVFQPASEEINTDASCGCRIL